ncbi:hypothetical protein QCA50_004807 [Cerrena zonata]|uniref:DUF6534 domain-containing protein n=1 Tax=Cerrena zonata TaxID=2478898 RepID=A0AAW0GD85_9APHY
MLGYMFNWGLFGALTVQTYVYYLSFPRDRRSTKVIVYSTYIIELLQTVLSTRDAFRVFGSGWGDLAEMNKVGWLWFSVPVLGSIISLIAQGFYAFRIWILSKNWWVCSAIISVSMAQCAAGFYSGYFSHKVGDFSKVQDGNFRMVSVWLAGTALCDVIIAVSMIWYLQRSKTGVRKTTVIITKFVHLTMETGASCAALAVIDLVLFLVYRHNNYHLAPSIALSKLYSNCLLVAFNARLRIVGGRNEEDSTLSGSAVARYLSEFAAAERDTMGSVLSKPIAVAVSQSRTTSVQVDLGPDSYPMRTSTTTRGMDSSISKKGTHLHPDFQP